MVAAIATTTPTTSFHGVLVVLGASRRWRRRIKRHILPSPTVPLGLWLLLIRLLLPLVPRPVTVGRLLVVGVVVVARAGTETAVDVVVVAPGDP